MVVLARFLASLSIRLRVGQIMIAVHSSYMSRTSEFAESELPTTNWSV